MKKAAFNRMRDAGIRLPMFVPISLRVVRMLLDEGRVEDTCAELFRLIRLGSQEAAAVLGFMYVCGLRWDGASEYEIAAACRLAASQGDRYAQYVVALQAIRKRDYDQGWYWLDRSNQQNFGAALGETSRLAANVIRKPKLVVPYARRGIHVYHLPSLIVLLMCAKRGDFGLIWRTLAIFSFPAAFVAYVLAIRCFPYSENVFMFLGTPNESIRGLRQGI